jgi:hypothetical protein
MVELTLLSRRELRNMTSRRDVFRLSVEYILLPALGLWRVKPAVATKTELDICGRLIRTRAIVFYSTRTSTTN